MVQDDVSNIQPYAPMPGQPAYTPVREVYCKARGACQAGVKGKGMMIPTEGLHRGHQCRQCKEFFHNLCTGSEGPNKCNPKCTGATATPAPTAPPAIRRQPVRPPGGRRPQPAASNRRQRPAPRAAGARTSRTPGAFAKLGTCYYHMMSDLEKRSNLMQDPQNFPVLKNNFRQLHDISVPGVTQVSQC